MVEKGDPFAACDTATFTSYGAFTSCEKDDPFAACDAATLTSCDAFAATFTSCDAFTSCEKDDPWKDESSFGDGDGGVSFVAVAAFTFLFKCPFK